MFSASAVLSCLSYYTYRTIPGLVGRCLFPFLFFYVWINIYKYVIACISVCFLSYPMPLHICIDLELCRLVLCSRSILVFCVLFLMFSTSFLFFLALVCLFFLGFVSCYFVFLSLFFVLFCAFFAFCPSCALALFVFVFYLLYLLKYIDNKLAAFTFNPIICDTVVYKRSPNDRLKMNKTIITESVSKNMPNPTRSFSPWSVFFVKDVVADRRHVLLIIFSLSFYSNSTCFHMFGVWFLLFACFLVCVVCFWCVWCVWNQRKNMINVRIAAMAAMLTLATPLAWWAVFWSYSL